MICFGFDMKLVKVQDFYFYMKSGNKIFVDNVMMGKEAFTYTFEGSNVTGIKNFGQIRPRYRLLLGSLSLSQIEAIVTEGSHRYKLVF